MLSNLKNCKIFLKEFGYSDIQMGQVISTIRNTILCILYWISRIPKFVKTLRKICHYETAVQLRLSRSIGGGKKLKQLYLKIELDRMFSRLDTNRLNNCVGCLFWLRGKTSFRIKILSRIIYRKKELNLKMYLPKWL